MREKKYEEIVCFCKEHDVDFVTIRNVQKSGKTRIKITAKCRKCNNRFDVTSDTLRKQKYPGLCTRCAHIESAIKNKLTAQKVVNGFQSFGYKVLTPIDKIKPVGKHNSFLKSKVLVQDKNGTTYYICWNNFWSRRDTYIALNNGGYSAAGTREPSPLEALVANYLDEIGVAFKREFKFSDCSGDYAMLPFDFCINYKSKEKMLIEVDGPLHYKTGIDKNRQKYDRTKNLYCETNGIPLLRIPYWEFDEAETYKQKIQSFIKNRQE